MHWHSANELVSIIRGAFRLQMKDREETVVKASTDVTHDSFAGNPAGFGQHGPWEEQFLPGTRNLRKEAPTGPEGLFNRLHTLLT